LRIAHIDSSVDYICRRIPVATRHDVIHAFRKGAGRLMVCAAWLVATAAMAQAPARSPSPLDQPLRVTPGAHPTPLPAPPAEGATPVSPLTVQGMAKAELQKRAHDFVESYAQPTKKLELLAKWNDPACVAVIGLVPAQAAEFKSRIEAVAKQVGAPVGGPKCAPNIEIVFTKEPQHTLDATVARRPELLGDGRDKKVTRPIQAWYATQDDGVRARTAGPADDGPPPATAGEMIAHVPVERFNVTRGWAEARRCVDDGVAKHQPKLVSHLVGAPTYVVDIPCLHSLFLNVLIVVDVAHMGDVSVDLTSDYLALVALSQPKPRALDGCLALPSVLDLYAVNCPGREAPTGLTPADRAYLSGLYAADLTEVTFKQSAQSDIAGRMVKILTPAKASGR
jgi:hypothetical protein